MSKQQRTPFPLRLEPDLAAVAREQAAAQDRSVNWIVNHFFRKGAQQLVAGKENAPTVAAVEAPI